MAMGILRSKTSEDQNWIIESAGVWARQGYPVHNYVNLLLQEKGVDISQHRSRSITREIINKFNLILVMETGHKEGLRVAYPDTASKVYLLSELIDQRYDIVDPIGGSIVDFKETAQEIEHILNDGFFRIKRLASGIVDEK